MKNYIESTLILDEARATVKKRSYIKITLIFLFVYFLSALVISLASSICLIIYGFFNTNSAQGFMNSNGESIDSSNIIDLVLNAAIIICSVVYCTRFERRRLFTMGFIKKGAISSYLAGLLTGLVMFSVAFGIIYLSGGFASVRLNTEITYSIIFLSFFGFMIQGMSEEVLLRGYYMVSLTTRGNIPLAIFVSSIIFALLHIGNSGINVIGLINIFLFGIFASLHFIRRGNIWGISALHSIWNFAQGNIFGCLVSGNDSGGSIIVTEAKNGVGFINGGEFGPEGGIAVTIVLSFGIAVLFFMKNKTLSGEITERTVPLEL